MFFGRLSNSLLPMNLFCDFFFVALFWLIIREHSDKGSFIFHTCSMKFRFFSEEFGFVSP
jgi:hypothetical protein